MLKLVTNGEVYSPKPLGRMPILFANDKILKVGGVDEEGVKRLGVEYEVINAEGGWVLPGLIDPHQHLLGGSGESGFSSQTSEISATEIINAA